MDGSPGILLILDGWGHAPAAPGNALAAAASPFLDALVGDPAGLLLEASGGAVGLPEGVVGNSEIGHMVMGAGRPLEYDSLLVQRQAESGALRTHPVLRDVCGRLVREGGTLHLVGLCSDGRIHADIGHLPEVLRAVRAAGLERCAIHAITDGRDVPEGTSGRYLSALTTMTEEIGVGFVAGVIGRDYAMDKSGRDDLTAKASRLLLDGAAERTAPDAESAVRGHDHDGSVPPTAVTDPAGTPTTVRDGDVILFMNFRSDRTAPLVDRVADDLASDGRTRVRLLSLGRYDTRAEVPALVPRADASGGVADALEEAGVRSLRIAEREKFDHVTFFFNGRDARRRTGEEHVLVPPAADGPVQDHPEMNIDALGRAVVEGAGRGDVGLVVANLANMDVVGHTGSYEATCRAVTAVDRVAARICAAARDSGHWVLLVGDHGNAEQMLTSPEDGSAPRPYGGHTRNPVPCALVTADGARPAAPAGAAIPSIGPTVLHLLGVPVPAGMSAPSLFTLRSRQGALDDLR
ncbi:2,3-bisphosphoglycerate-independent phosphoglycerate mutase [Thermomonospora umbrina]|uniref:2,3-bisphosphoglycerate-independent phosphoglycerate mutase n=1 Tax=Thermomonospora umbrina TaxID=111806 RepID=A0A3D9SVD8_9ACTN|nr:2,3-bisphosphoglycerate-independent phosphoglycerate mutase [Thermomonospora umbrina]REE99929.1 phosphoglycerate mutase [Thermomonospora umbrina]